MEIIFTLTLIVAAHFLTWGILFPAPRSVQKVSAALRTIPAACLLRTHRSMVSPAPLRNQLDDRRELFSPPLRA